MPLPLGHATIGLAVHSLCSGNESGVCRWKALIGILILSNLPDLDVVLGIIFHGNGNIFHRGPTHSLIFAFIGGFLASRLCKFWSQLPKLDFKICFLLILSHVVADFVFTNSAISFFWPITVNWSNGYSGLRDVVNLVLFGNFKDVQIVIGFALLVILYRTLAGFGLLKASQKLKGIFKL